MSNLIRQMGHVVIGSPDPEGAAKHLSDVTGVRVTDRDGDTVYTSSNERHHEVTYVPGNGEVIAMGLEVINAAALDTIYERAKSDGLQILSDQPIGPHYDRALRLVAPGGSVFELHTPIAANQTARYIGGGGARPKRIEHVNFWTPQIAAFKEFLEGVLGMELSDKTSDEVGHWYRAADGYHHCVAVLGTDELRFHHYAFDHNSLYDLQRIADNLHVLDEAMAYGPGRHGAGDNIFTYYLDPHGCLVENSTEMAHIDHWEPSVWDVSAGMAAKWINKWGTPPPPVFDTAGIPFAKTD
ncbi:MAG: VOC family protein [Pseudomonadota bacterium]